VRWHVVGSVIRILRARHIFKVVFIGDPAVGKTSVVAKHVSAAFKENYIPTLGTNISSKDYNIAGNPVSLMIWDIAGQEIFKTVIEKYFEGANAAFIVYDVTRPETYQSVVVWHEEMMRLLPKTMPVIVVGNKTDLPRRVDRKDGEKIANQLNADYIETSAKTGANIDVAFDRIARKLLSEVMKVPQKKK
jgi:small GTP-binding protein